MALPAAVAARANRASDLIREAETRRSGMPAAATPATPAAAADAASLQKKLEDTLAELKKAQDALQTLQGKYNAELPRAQAELRKATSDLKSATEKAAKLDADLKKKIETGEVTSLTPEMRKLLGEDFIKGIVQIAREVVGNEVAARVQPLADQFDELQRMTEEGFFVALDQLVPDWAVVNDQPEFEAWLGQVDPGTKRQRMALLRNAEKARQGYRAVEIFNAFKEGREIGVPKQPAGSDPLERRAEPGQGGGEEPNAEVDKDGKKIWAQSEIKKFYDDRRRGNYRGKEAEARSLEADIFAAQREGRVRAG